MRGKMRGQWAPSPNEIFNLLKYSEIHVDHVLYICSYKSPTIDDVAIISYYYHYYNYYDYYDYYDYYYYNVNMYKILQSENSLNTQYSILTLLLFLLIVQHSGVWICIS